MIDETKIGTPPVDPCAYGHGDPLFHEPSGRYVCTSPKCPNTHAAMPRADWTWTQRRIVSRLRKCFEAGWFACDEACGNFGGDMDKEIDRRFASYQRDLIDDAKEEQCKKK